MLCVVCDTFFGPQNTFSTAHVSIGQNFEHEQDFQHDRAIFCSSQYDDIHSSCSSLPRISPLRSQVQHHRCLIIISEDIKLEFYLKIPINILCLTRSIICNISRQAYMQNQTKSLLLYINIIQDIHVYFMLQQPVYSLIFSVCKNAI